MTPYQQRLQNRFLRRLREEAPGLQKELMAAWNTIAANIPVAEVERLLRLGSIEDIIRALLNDAKLDAALFDARINIQEQVASAVKWTAAEMPFPSISVAFNVLNPAHVDAVRELNDKVMDVVKRNVRESFRAFLENGIRDGRNPASVAREVKDWIGLSGNQTKAVLNFERMLTDGDREALTRELRDKRFDSTLKRLLGADGDGLSAKQIDTMTDAYRRGMLAHNAQTLAYTATRDATKVGNQIAWFDAIDRGIVPADRVMKQWLHLDGQKDPRPEHEALNGEVAPIDEPYSNGDLYAGENDPWNCFVADTAVEGAFVAGLKIPYTGTLREIVTARGYRLTVTPNHPILTPNGWTPAHLCAEGTTLFSNGGDVGNAPLVGVDHEHRPTTVEDVFNALPSQRPLPPSTTLHLNGDAQGIIGQVDVVGADWELAHECWPLLLDDIDDGILPNTARDGAEHVDTDSRVLALANTPLASARGLPRIAEQTLRFDGIASNVLPPQVLPIGAAADWDVRVPKVFGEGVATVAEFLRQLEQACSGTIAADQVVSVREYEAVGMHVYDLQSVTGWLLAGNIVCSNCHCRDIMFVGLENAA